MQATQAPTLFKQVANNAVKTPAKHITMHAARSHTMRAVESSDNSYDYDSNDDSYSFGFIDSFSLSHMGCDD